MSGQTSYVNVEQEGAGTPAFIIWVTFHVELSIQYQISLESGIILLPIPIKLRETTGVSCLQKTKAKFIPIHHY